MSINQKNVPAPSVFLSHATTDKRVVERVGKFLSTHGVTVWIDSRDLKAGTGIIRNLEIAVSECDHLLLFLTPKAERSGWIRKEWETKLHLHINEKSNHVIPLLIEDCTISPFLRDLNHIDFRNDFEEGLSKLLAALQVPQQVQRPHHTIGEYTSDFLGDLDGQFLAFPSMRRIEIINTLRRLPRSGKMVRLEKYNTPPIPIRSIYDHILSVAHSADCLMPVTNHGIADKDFHELARCIAYHELNEVLLGDIPSSTNLSQNKRNTARLFAEQRLRSIETRERERIANQFIWMYLDNTQRSSMLAMEEILKKRDSNVTRFFKLLDKIDPIIAVWRYLHVFRGTLRGPHKFLKRLRDFFENTDVRDIAKDFKKDQRVYDLITTLQNRDMAMRYYEKKDVLSEQETLFGFSPGVVSRLIEGRGFMFATGDIFGRGPVGEKKQKPRPRRLSRSR